MTTKGMICFDMDGTIADLYGVQDWEHLLRVENPIPYIIAEPMWDMDKLAAVLNKLIEQGWEIRVISWLARDASSEYDDAVRAAKTWWLNYYHFPYKKAHLVAYGTTKANCIRKIAEKGKAILIDDNEKIRKGWHMGETINPADGDLIERLEALLENQTIQLTYLAIRGERNIMEIFYKAFDGKIFSDKDECEDYEFAQAIVQVGSDIVGMTDEGRIISYSDNHFIDRAVYVGIKTKAAAEAFITRNERAGYSGDGISPADCPAVFYWNEDNWDLLDNEIFRLRQDIQDREYISKKLLE